MSALEWPAPAKLNLFLHVCGRRPDGYHLLQTVFQLLDYGDVLRFRIRDDGSIGRATELPGVPEQDDLCVRAARLLQHESGCRLGADIELDKRLPLGGGLGGGSSDAATTLVALNALWRTGLDLDALSALGLRLGADVPVFVRGMSSWGEGVGEQLRPIELGAHWYLVVSPEVPVSTARVFGARELTRNTPRITMAAFRAGLATAALRSTVGNDCEPVVRQLYPDVARALDWLGQFADARLTGTGGCVYAAFDTEQAARVVCRQVPPPWRAFVAQGVDVSPLRRAVERLAA
jgi:4-diphosphocytidyl-2-C-methyl-D-erythritol kinase